jgi:hypothetical protein
VTGPAFLRPGVGLVAFLELHEHGQNPAVRLDWHGRPVVE